eukprot:SAG11_NODE_514_length_8830_cov_19.471484_3_plen_130_part_00
MPTDPYIFGRNFGAVLVCAHTFLMFFSGTPGTSTSTMGAIEQTDEQRRLAWGLFCRGLAVVYTVAFLSVLIQIRPLCGTRGVTPLRPQLAAIERDFGRWRGALFYFPSLFWLTGVISLRVAARGRFSSE